MAFVEAMADQRWNKSCGQMYDGAMAFGLGAVGSKAVSSEVVFAGCRLGGCRLVRCWFGGCRLSSFGFQEVAVMFISSLVARSLLFFGGPVCHVSSIEI